jgi:hypothetical protein
MTVVVVTIAAAVAVVAATVDREATNSRWANFDGGGGGGGDRGGGYDRGGGGGRGPRRVTNVVSTRYTTISVSKLVSLIARITKKKVSTRTTHHPR